MKAFYSSLFPLNLPDDHRFPMRKYSRLREILRDEKIVADADLREASPATSDDLLLVHDPEYVRRVVRGELSPRELRRLGFPWSEELAARAHATVGASLAAARAALQEGFGANLAGGTHHADRDAASGYCVFNDFAVTATRLLEDRRVDKVLILDLDVHQGNGTAKLLAGEPRAFTASLHGKDNFPFRKEVSDLDVELPTGTGDTTYLAALDGALDEIRRRFGRPDLVLFLAGADPHEADRYGRMKLTVAGLRKRDERVFAAFAPEVPVAVAMGGGYGPDVDLVARLHATTIALGAAAYPGSV